VHHVQVDVVDADPLEAAFSLRNRILAAGQNLVVMNTSSRGTSLSRRPCPTLSSLP
jgi:hypothetical protein